MKGRFFFVGARHCLAPFAACGAVDGGRRMRRPYEALSPALCRGGFQTRPYERSLLLRRGEALPRPFAACGAVDGGRRMPRPYEALSPALCRGGFQTRPYE